MIDLHIHTSYSDGEYNEFEILDKIKEAKITEFAICDHDTIEGSQKVYELVKNDNSLIFHPGVELSCRVNTFLNGINVHLLARDFDYNNINIRKLVNKAATNRYKKIERMVDLIKEKYNFIVPKKDIEEELKHTYSFGKPHMYKILTRYIEADREKYYRTMDKLNSDDLKLDAISVLEELKNTKANVTLAHPIEIMKEYNLTYKDIDDLVNYLSKYNLYGLETKHSNHSEKDYEEYSKIAKKYNLKETQGSDYHGPKVKPTVKLGVCKK